VAAVVAAVPAGFAGTDGVASTNMVSVIESVVPDLPGDVSVDIVAGDSHVRVRSDAVAVAIPGYEGEPYLRIDPDGTVWANENSVTRLINASRYGESAGDVPDEVDWKRIGSDGAAMWHDHRIHWMNPVYGPTAGDGGVVQTWDIPMTVDGVATVVSGSLYLRAATGWWWWLAGLPVLVVMSAVLSRRRSRVGAESVLLATASGSVAIAAVQFTALPYGARVAPTFLLLSMLAGAFAVVALAGIRRGPFAAALTTGGASSLALAVALGASQVRDHHVPGLAGSAWLMRLWLPILLGVALPMILSGLARIWWPEHDR
jgi:hypothetical protein